MLLRTLAPTPSDCSTLKTILLTFLAFVMFNLLTIKKNVCLEYLKQLLRCCASQSINVLVIQRVEPVDKSLALDSSNLGIVIMGIDSVRH